MMVKLVAIVFLACCFLAAFSAGREVGRTEGAKVTVAYIKPPDNLKHPEEAWSCGLYFAPDAPPYAGKGWTVSNLRIDIGEKTVTGICRDV